MSYESEREELFQEATRRIAVVYDKHKDAPASGRDGPRTIEEKAINDELIAKLQILCKKYNKKTI